MKQNKRSLILWLVLIVVLAVASVLTGTPGGESESVKAVMRDAVLHETGQVSLFGIMDVNPGLISAYVVTAALLVLAVCLRIFAVPHFTEVPGKLQMQTVRSAFMRPTGLFGILCYICLTQIEVSNSLRKRRSFSK